MHARTHGGRLADALGTTRQRLEQFVDLHPSPTPGVVLRSGAVDVGETEIDEDTRARLQAFIDARKASRWVLPEDVVTFIDEEGPVTIEEIQEAFSDDVTSRSAFRWYISLAIESEYVEAVEDTRPTQFVGVAVAGD